MYFSNITNTELNKLPKVYAPNFSIKLTDILHKTNGVFDNKLFRIEEIITDKIYKIYPMFNTRKISSSNTKDKIFSNKLIICLKETKETYITFIRNENEEVTDFTEIGTYYSIEDTLTDNQYNAIIQLIRASNIINESIHIQSDTIHTKYGDYDFTFTGLILDNGIEITNLTTLTCKLSNQAFSHATYTLNLQALRITNTNVETEDSTNNKTIIPVSVELVNDSTVNIDTTNLQVGDIILYDGIITITQDKPVIIGSWLNQLVVNADKTIIQKNDRLDLTATATDINDIPIVGKTIYFYKKQED